MSKNDQLERDIFGGSESELSDVEDLQQKQRQQQPPRPRSPKQGEQESSGEESGEDDYVQERPAKPRRKARARKDDETVERGTSRKRKRRQPPPEIDLSELPPEQAKQMKLDMQIEAILKPKKSNRAKKRNKDEEALDRFADEEVSRLREAMIQAADEDIRANKEKMPAASKLRLLPEVMEVLRKASLAQSIVDNNLLEGVKRWLEPLSDKSLPALNIQREFFPALKKMEFIDSAVLKESGLGPIILFYTKCKRVTPDISRIANELVSIWSRPIIKRSASYRDRVVPEAVDAAGLQKASGEKLSAILARTQAADKTRVRKNAVSIPQSSFGGYTVAPKINAGLASSSNASVQNDIERRKRNAERLRSLTRKVSAK